MLRGPVGQVKFLTLRKGSKSKITYDLCNAVTYDALAQAEAILVERQKTVQQEFQAKRQRQDDNLPIEDLEADWAGNSFAPLAHGVRVTKKGKKTFTVEEIQLEGVLRKEISQHQKELKQIQKDLSLLESTRDNAGKTIGARQRGVIQLLRMGECRNLSEDEVKSHPQYVAVEGQVLLPMVESALPGIEFRHDMARFVLDRVPGFVDFIDRNPGDIFWRAPEESVKDGVIQPLPIGVENWLLNNSQLKPSDWFALDQSNREKVAWRWLIVSHNSTRPSTRVPLNKKLSNNCSLVTPGGGSGLSPAVSAVDAIREKLAVISKQSSELKPGQVSLDKGKIRDFFGFTLQLVAALGGTGITWDNTQRMFVADPEGDAALHQRCSAMNKWAESASKLRKQLVDSELSMGLAKFSGEVAQASNVASDAGSSSEQEAKGSEQSDPGPPMSINLEDRTWFLRESGVVDLVGTRPFTTLKVKGVLYVSYDRKEPLKPEGAFTSKAGETTVGDVPISFPKGKGKKTSPSTPPAGSRGASPAGQRNSPSKKGGSSQPAALTSGQETKLKEFFKTLSGKVPDDEWAKMDNARRRDALKARSIPKWAVGAVLAESSHLDKILKGVITKDNAASFINAPTLKEKSSSGQAMDAWLDLKSSFKGVALLRSPTTAKEKALKKRFEMLVAEYGDQPNFPKLKDNSDGASNNPVASRKKAGAGAVGSELDMLKIIVEVVKALKS
jgi:hypothetical protein